MLKHSTRRWLAGIGVAGAFVAASATPAAAEDSQIELGVYFGDTTVAAGSEGKIEYSTIHSSAPVVLRDLTIKYDYSDLAGKVTLKEEEDTFSDCTSASDNVLVCTEQFEVGLDEWGLAGIFPVVVAPTDKAQDGDTGKLKVTMTAAGFDAVSHEATVRIGEGVDLQAGPETELSLAPGTKFTAPLKVSNAGETTAKGASVVFFNDYGLNAGKHYSNCTYVGDELRTCQFKDELPAGTSFGTSLPYVLGADSFAPGFKYGEIIWMTPAEFEDFEGYLENYDVTIGEPGTDGELTLAQAGAQASIQGFQADTNQENNWSSLAVKVTGKNSTDLEAIGDKLTGKAGDKVTATVGVRNNGPATLDYSRGGGAVTMMSVDVPQGTTAVGVPQNCAPVKDDKWGEPGKPGARHYGCYFEPFLKAGEESLLDFDLRIDKVIANATGVVKVNVPCQCDGGFYSDVKPANDTAEIVVNAAAGNGGGQGGGGTLPITGSSTALIAGIGGLLLAAGIGGFVVARRRRTRFVA